MGNKAKAGAPLAGLLGVLVLGGTVAKDCIVTIQPGHKGIGRYLCFVASACRTLSCQRV